MSKFLNRFALTEELRNIIVDAEEYLILISPYFKLNDSIRNAMSKHFGNKKFHLTIVYGKNEDNRVKSMGDQDMDFFRSFSNVEIRYHKRLHAKIYANERNCLLTSMNLHDFSMNENIEFGILTQTKMLDMLSVVRESSLDYKAFEFCEYIIDKSEIEFKKEVEKTKSFFGLVTKYGDANVEVNKRRNGYCIRNGSPIPFSIERPLSKEAFDSWSKYGNPHYAEKFCHACGASSQTSMSRPLCYRCFKMFDV